MPLNRPNFSSVQSAERLRLTPYAHRFDASLRAQLPSSVNPLSLHGPDLLSALSDRSEAIIEQLKGLSREALMKTPDGLERSPYDPTDVNIQKVGRHILLSFMGWEVARLLAEREVIVDFRGFVLKDPFCGLSDDLWAQLKVLIEQVFATGGVPLSAFDQIFGTFSHRRDTSHHLMHLANHQLVMAGAITQHKAMERLSRAIPDLIRRDLLDLPNPPDIELTPSNLAAAFRSTRNVMTHLALQLEVFQFENDRMANHAISLIPQREPVRLDPCMAYFSAVLNEDPDTREEQPILIRLEREKFNEVVQAKPSARARLGCPMHIPPPPRKKRSSESPSPDPSGDSPTPPSNSSITEKSSPPAPRVPSLIQTYFDKYASLLPQAYAYDLKYRV